jgi:hypothetical protein
MSGDKIDPGVTTSPPRVGQLRRWSVNVVLPWGRMGDVFLVTDIRSNATLHALHEYKIVVEVMLPTGMARTFRFDYIVFASDPL